jgi:hypothetical protein
VPSNCRLSAVSSKPRGPPESVFLSGFILLRTVVVTDPDLGRSPIVLLDVDVSNVIGAGLRTGTPYISSGSQTLTRRSLLPM